MLVVGVQRMSLHVHLLATSHAVHLTAGRVRSVCAGFFRKLV